MKPKKRMRTLTVVILAIIAVLAIGGGVIFATLPSGTNGQDLSALLSEMVGVVQVKNNPQDQFAQVNNGFLLKSIMQLQTMTDSRVRLDLSTKSIVRVGPTTIFSLKSQQPATGGVLSQIELQAGRVWIVLQGGSIDVNTPAGLASVRGSYMSVWMDPKTSSITVCCLEGNCGFQDSAGDVEMTSGQKVISSDTNAVPPLQTMNQADIQSFLDNSPESVPIVTQIATLLNTATPTSTPATPTLANETATDTVTVTPTSDLTLLAGTGSPTAGLNSSLPPTLANTTMTITPTVLYSPTLKLNATPTVYATVAQPPTQAPTKVTPPTSAPTLAPTPTSPPPPTNTPVPPTAPAYPPPTP